MVLCEDSSHLKKKPIECVADTLKRDLDVWIYIHSFNLSITFDKLNDFHHQLLACVVFFFSFG